MAFRMTEVASGKLFALSGLAALDRPLSWIPEGVKGYDPHSAYLVLEPDAALLIDTGYAADRSAMLDGLSRLLPAGCPLRILLTRIEPDCVGNLEPILDAFPVPEVISLSQNPLDYVTPERRHEVTASFNRLMHGDAVDVGGNRRLLLVQPPLRIMATTWVWDEATGTLFTSDSFSHMQMTSPEDPLLVAEAGARVDPERVRRHLFTKFEWLRRAETGLLRTELDRVAAAYDIRRLAPAHGCLIEGREAVRLQFRMVQEALALCPLEKTG